VEERSRAAALRARAGRLPTTSARAARATWLPRSRELVRRGSSGSVEVMASHVASFDLGAGDRIVFSHGDGVCTLDGSGRSALGRGALVGSVAPFGAAAQGWGPARSG
jgi:hypothetical protein